MNLNKTYKTHNHIHVKFDLYEGRDYAHVSEGFERDYI